MTTFDIDDEFEAFMRKACPTVRETSTQYKESRRVFWAGAAAMFLFSTNQLTQLSDEDGFKELDKLKWQFDEFFHKRIGFSD